MSKARARRGQHAVFVDWFKVHPPSARIIVDVGVFGRKNSNSWNLIKGGWRGILVEPRPASVARISQEFVGDFAVVQMAISDHFSAAEDLYISASPGCSSLNDDWRPELHTGKTIKVVVDTLPSLLFNHKVPERFGVLDVDTEGHDPRVIIPMLRDTKWRPDLLVVEYIDNDLYLALLEGRYKFIRKFGIDSLWAYQEPTV